MEDYTQHLLSYLPPTRLLTLSCGHVIPPSNLLALPLTTGPTALPFDFTFSSRANPRMIDELGNALLALTLKIPDGLVVFFPSYAYLAQVVSRWQLSPPASPSPHQKSIYDALALQKPIFAESKATPVDELLHAYSHAIASGHGRGALLLAVIGGSLSEGINFSDALGRGVVVVGLPFPNNQSAEWRAKLAHIERSAPAAAKEGGSAADAKTAAAAFYLNATMRAVNQSIGRAIRHRGDYAAIVLVDRRYGTGRIQGKLPGWIREGVREAKGFKEAVGEVEGFFAGKGGGGGGGCA